MPKNIDPQLRERAVRVVLEHRSEYPSSAKATAVVGPAMSTYTCPVCGYPKLTEAPRTESAGSYEICWSCGFEFGVTDDDLGYTYYSWRQLWIDRGMPWDSEPLHPQPLGWDPAQQLADVIGDDEP